MLSVSRHYRAGPYGLSSAHLKANKGLTSCLWRPMSFGEPDAAACASDRVAATYLDPSRALTLDAYQSVGAGISSPVPLDPEFVITALVSAPGLA